MTGGDSIVVLSEAISFGQGKVASATFFDDQPFGQGYKTNATRKGVLITEKEGWPALLRQLADLMEQEGAATIKELSAAAKRLIS